MVTFTIEERAAITSTWTDVDLEELGKRGLARMLVVYPWTRINFKMFGDISNSAAILANPQIRALGKKVASVLGNVVMNLNNVEGTVTGLAKWHADNIKVDPEHFKHHRP
ncbi:hemoglobin subunit gamma-like [Polyodon spathula]|uniref:hemoglobin subunit gamma-like n=1 Tax=Polyodon spathula TaxID=7913 RepID=UPI001B7DFCC8|nr:hemoglobin subunit gamma-like [Polyodon spathula]